MDTAPASCFDTSCCPSVACSCSHPHTCVHPLSLAYMHAKILFSASCGNAHAIVPMLSLQQWGDTHQTQKAHETRMAGGIGLYLPHIALAHSIIKLQLQGRARLACRLHLRLQPSLELLHTLSYVNAHTKC